MSFKLLLNNMIVFLILKLYGVNAFVYACMRGTILSVSVVALLYSCIFPDVQLAHVRNESEVMEETSPPLPFTSGKGGAESEKVRLVLLLFMNIFC